MYGKIDKKLRYRLAVYVFMGAVIAWFLTGGKGSVLPIYLLVALAIFGIVTYHQFLNNKD